MFSCRIDIEPKPAPRPRVTKIGQVYMEAWYKEYLSNIRLQADKYLCGYCSHDPIRLKVEFHRNIPVKQKRFGDVDNLIKGVMDALIGYGYYDDAQIVEVTGIKCHSETPCIKIYMEYLEG